MRMTLILEHTVRREVEMDLTEAQEIIDNFERDGSTYYEIHNIFEESDAQTMKVSLYARLGGGLSDEVEIESRSG